MLIQGAPKRKQPGAREDRNPALFSTLRSVQCHHASSTQLRRRRHDDFMAVMALQMWVEWSEIRIRVKNRQKETYSSPKDSRVLRMCMLNELIWVSDSLHYTKFDWQYFFSFPVTNNFMEHFSVDKIFSPTSLKVSDYFSDNLSEHFSEYFMHILTKKSGKICINFENIFLILNS
jgi:hypothetical protein